MTDVLDLPSKVTSFVAKGRRYYRYRHKGVSVSLGSDLDTALEKARALTEADVEASQKFANHQQRQISGYVKDAMRLKKASARYRDQEVSITEADIDEMLRAQDYKCAVSGIPFEFSKTVVWNPEAERNRHPFAPSMDRIKPGGPYSRENCRLVCLIVNLARSNFGDEALLTMAKGIVMKAARSI